MFNAHDFKTKEGQRNAKRVLERLAEARQAKAKLSRLTTWGPAGKDTLNGALFALMDLKFAVCSARRWFYLAMAAENIGTDAQNWGRWTEAYRRVANSSQSEPMR